MTEILTSPLTWMFLSIFCYAIGVAIQQKTGSPLCNPLLIASDSRRRSAHRERHDSTRPMRNPVS
ncbi:MAG: hypothetical protein ACLR4Z_01870 [Butyricicoccaceae bacterium]